MSPLTLEDLRHRHHEDLSAVNSLLAGSLARCAEPVVADLAASVERARGKQLRPLLVLELAGGAPAALAAAAAVEAIHCASLVHDDLIDRCLLRRGRPTMNALHGDGPAVLLGDLLFTSIFDLAASTGDITLVREASATIRTLIEGELMQQRLRGSLDIDMADYHRVIGAKTAALLAFAAASGARLAGHPPAIEQAARDYAHGFGLIFQIADDWQDFARSGLPDEKERGQDIANGFMTLPWILLAQSGPAGRCLVASLLREARPAGLDTPAVAELARLIRLPEQVAAHVAGLEAECRRSLALLSPSCDAGRLEAFLEASLQVLRRELP